MLCCVRSGCVSSDPWWTCVVGVVVDGGAVGGNTVVGVEAWAMDATKPEQDKEDCNTRSSRGTLSATVFGSAWSCWMSVGIA